MPSSAPATTAAGGGPTAAPLRWQLLLLLLLSSFPSASAHSNGVAAAPPPPEEERTIFLTAGRGRERDFSHSFLQSCLWSGDLFPLVASRISPGVEAAAEASVLGLGSGRVLAGPPELPRRPCAACRVVPARWREEAARLCFPRRVAGRTPARLVAVSAPPAA